MTYLDVHLYFILPAIVMSFVFARKELSKNQKSALKGIGLLCLLALVYTTPWDNYLVFKEVWWYGADKVLGTIYYVPVEEYAFFLLQTIMSGLFFLAYTKPSNRKLEDVQSPQRVFYLYPLGLFWLGTFALLFFESTFYLGLILTWGLPVILLQVAAGAPYLLLRWKSLAMTVLLPTFFLWVADAIAIHQGVWAISEKYTIGLKPFGLPIEEMTFFFVTNTMVVFGLTLFLEPAMQREAQKFFDSRSSSANVGAHS